MIRQMKLEIFKRSVPAILKELYKTTDLKEIRYYEDLLISSIISSLSIGGGLMNLIVRLFWKDPMIDILIASFFFFFFGLSLDRIVYTIKNSKIRAFLISICMNGLLFNVTLSYYQRLGALMWTTIFLLMIVSIIRMDQIIFFSIGIGGIIMNFYLYFVHVNDVIVLNQLYYMTQIGLFLVIYIIGLLWNRLYQERYRRSHKLFKEAVYGKEEVTQLFEELVATEEELRKQNEVLNRYNEEIKANHEELHRLIYRDELTGLANRKCFLEKVQSLIDMNRTEDEFAIVFVDLDGFKKINDTMGHPIGDIYLCEVGMRLTALLGEEDVLGRFGGDEFAILLQHVHEKEDLSRYINQFREALNQPYEIDTYRIFSSASFGVSIYPKDARLITELLKTADAAMYKAKEKGKNAIQFFKKEMKEEVLLKIELENELADATDRNEFFLVYQPQVDLVRKRVRGFEALLRWESPNRGIVPPNDFIPVLESTGLIIPVGDWVLEEVCKKISDMMLKGIMDFCISVNISSLQIQEDTFVDGVKRLMEHYDIPKNTLELEITESVFALNTDGVIAKMNALKAMGIIIALDDFGTGYSSLSYLRLMPIDVLKIDKSFIWDLEKGNKEQKIVGSIIDLVHDMDILVIAEGVESEFQYEYLEEKKCDYIQGYLVSHPIKSTQMEEIICLNTL